MSLETEVTIAIPLEREKLDQGEKILFLNIFNNKVMIHVQNHWMYNTKSDLQCKLWALSDYDVSM